MRLIESLSGTGDDTYTYTGNVSLNGITFSNDGSASATIVFGNHTVVVKAGEAFETNTKIPFTTVAITTSGDWRLIVGD